MEKFTKTERKSILAYSIELLVFAVVFGILGILRITGVIGYSESRRVVFNWITLVGGTIGIGDFIWFCFSKRRRARNFLPDKLAVLALAIFMITYDLICLIGGNPSPEFCTYMLGGAICYVAVIYLFQGIYHYFKPVPSYLEDIRKAIAEDEAAEKAKAEEKAKKAEAEKQNNEDNKDAN